MKKIILVILSISSFTICNAQKPDTSNNSPRITEDGYIIINSQKSITDEMIFYVPDEFERNKAPLFLVNGKVVITIAMYNRDEIKQITVLQPKEGSIKFGKKGKNGAVIVALKDEVKSPEIQILTNRLYYKCAIEGKLIDTSKEYYDKNGGKNCSILDLRDTSKIQTLYLNFFNEIKVKNLGVGWDRAKISVSGASASGSSGVYRIFIKEQGVVKIVISTCGINNNCKQKEFKFRVLPLPTLNP